MDDNITAHILVVDDDKRLRSLLQRYLGSNGFVVTCASDTRDARKKLTYCTFDMLILDVMMPGESGMDFARAYVPEHDTPVIMLTAMGDSQDRIAGLEAGVADYMAKPFEPRELVLRINNILSKTMQDAVPVSRIVSFGDFRYDCGKKRLTAHDAVVHLTDSELATLHELASQFGQPVARDMLSASLAGPDDEPNLRSADVMITRLRKKIEAEPSKPVYLQTVRGEGYMLRD